MAEAERAHVHPFYVIPWTVLDHAKEGLEATNAAVHSAREDKGGRIPAIRAHLRPMQAVAVVSPEVEALKFQAGFGNPDQCHSNVARPEDPPQVQRAMKRTAQAQAQVLANAGNC